MNYIINMWRFQEGGGLDPKQQYLNRQVGIR